jgi:hypothetical protein
MKTHGRGRRTTKLPAFALRAERALRRAAKNVRSQSIALKLPLVVWEDGKVVKKPA